MHRLHRGVAICLTVVCAVQTTGCTSWRTVPATVPTAVAQHPKRPLKVVLRDGRSRVADSVTTDTVTLIAFTPYAVDTFKLAEVKEVKVRQRSALKAVLAVLGVLVLAAAVGLMIYASDPSGPGGA